MQQVNFEPISNREDWIDQFEVRDNSNALVDLSAAAITFSVRDKNSKRVQLHAVVGSGVTVDGPGLFTIHFPVADMRGMDASLMYEVGCVITRNEIAQQFIIGIVPIVDGIIE